MMLPAANRDASKRSTMRDVAAMAGVSLKTVSRVINNEPSVAPDTQRKVRDAVQALRYVPDAAAANLARVSRETHSIALLISSVDNPFSASVFRGIESMARARQVAVFAASTEGDPAFEDTFIRAFTSRQVDGFIITPTYYDHRPVAHLIGDTPSVYIDRSPIGIAADVVTTNNREAAMIATAHLFQYGHRRIALLADDETIETATERKQGYLDALKMGMIDVDPDLIAMGIGTSDDGMHAAERILDLADPPTAIFASRNMASIGAMHALRARGLSHQIALVGMDDLELSDLTDPPMTVMAQDPVAIGQLAAECLFARMDGEDLPPTRHVVPSKLIARGSGEIPAPGRRP